MRWQITSHFGEIWHLHSSLYWSCLYFVTTFRLSVGIVSYVRSWIWLLVLESPQSWFKCSLGAIYHTTTISKCEHLSLQRSCAIGCEVNVTVRLCCLPNLPRKAVPPCYLTLIPGVTSNSLSYDTSIYFSWPRFLITCNNPTPFFCQHSEVIKAMADPFPTTNVVSDNKPWRNISTQQTQHTSLFVNACTIKIFQQSIARNCTATRQSPWLPVQIPKMSSGALCHYSAEVLSN